MGLRRRDHGSREYWNRYLCPHVPPDLVSNSLLVILRLLTQRKFSGVYVGLLLLHAIICSLATKFIAKLQILFVTLNIGFVSAEHITF
jgi:hypothetical protein